MLESDAWYEVCQATIKVEYEGLDGDVDQGQEHIKRVKEIELDYKNAARACKRAIHSDSLYNHLAKMGLQYGTAFQALQNVRWDNGGLAVAELNLQSGLLPYTGPCSLAHKIHPALVDALAQLPWACLTSGATKTSPTNVPNRMRNAWITADGLMRSDADKLYAFAKTSYRGLRGTDSTCCVVDEAGQLRMIVEHIETVAIAASQYESSLEAQQRNLCSYTEWKPDIEYLHPQNSVKYLVTNIQGNPPVAFCTNLKNWSYAFIRKT